MTKYILHGGFTRKDNELNRTFYGEVVRDIPDGGIILLIYFASRTEEHTTESFEYQIKMFTVAAHGKKINFVIATKEDFLDQLKRSDAVYFNGGSTNKLLKILRTYPDLKSLLEGKTVAGSSAGAYALAHFGASHDKPEVREGLGLVPIRVVCHYKSAKLPPNAESVSLLRNTSPELELIFLKDFEWKVFTL